MCILNLKETNIAFTILCFTYSSIIYSIQYIDYTVCTIDMIELGLFKDKFLSQVFGLLKLPKKGSINIYIYILLKKVIEILR